MTKTSAEISQLKTEKTIQRINEAKSWTKINKLDKHLAKLSTNVRRNKGPHLDDLGAFYYLLVVGDRRGTCTSRNNIGPLWGNQVPEPRERE